MTEPIAPATGGQGAAATPSAEPTPISSAPAPGTTAPAAATASTGLDWLTGASEEVTTYVQNKGWKAPTDLLTSYQQLEKHMGTPAERLLRLPDFDKAEKTEMDQFYNKLGRPAEPKGYDLPVPEGMPTDFAEAAKVKMHELGLTAKQARELAAWNNEMGATMAAKQKETYEATIAQQNAELKTEWGAAYDQEMGAAKNAAKVLGIKPEQIDALEGSLGFANLMKMMSNIGKRIGEDKFVDGGAGSNGAMTPAGAKARIQQLQGDKDWTAKYLSGNVQARAEMERLMQFAYPS